MNDFTWTIDQILGMAPDHLQLKAAESAATPDKWLSFGQDGSYAWGEFPSGQNTRYHASIALPHLGLACDCPSRKRPCRHSIALAILLQQQNNLFTEQNTPAWIKKQANRSSRQMHQFGHSRLGSKKQLWSIYQKQLQNVREGMVEFELWLRDLIHQGLAELTHKPATYWRQMTNRLADAEAYETAAELRQIAALPVKGPQWSEQLLRRIGRLYLLTQGFARYDSLLPETQSDLRYAAGWFANPNSGWSESLDDNWFILGKRHEWAAQKNRLRVWLWGCEHKRPALLTLQPGKDDLLARPFISGTTIKGEMHFYPSAWPMRAQIGAGYRDADPGADPSAFRSLAVARRAYGKALSLNPWLRHFPLLLRGIQVQQNGQRWMLRDGEGYWLPLPAKFLHGWHLQAVTQNEKSALFGEWNGADFQPLTIYLEEKWIDLHTLRGVN